MAGGVGSRFWPGSRESRPKQFLDILGVGKSLLRTTYERFLPLILPENILIVTHEMYRDLVKSQIPELTDGQILCEPSRNNTAPSVAYTALKLTDLNPSANFVMAPSDHVVLKESIFLACIQTALIYTEQNDALLTLGIQPSRADTGYGYIRYKKGQKDGATEVVFPVVQFTEKPDLERAKSFIASGEYLWNAGIFIWKAKDILRAFQQYAPDIYEILEKGKGSYNQAGETAFIQTHYPTTRPVSIDYAIMEQAKNVFTIPSDFGWSDLGTWASLHAEGDKDEQGNFRSGGQCLLHDVGNSLIRTQTEKLTVIRGLEDYIVIDEKDVLLIYPKSKEQDVKKVTETLKSVDELKNYL